MNSKCQSELLSGIFGIFGVARVLVFYVPIQSLLEDIHIFHHPTVSNIPTPEDQLISFSHPSGRHNVSLEGVYCSTYECRVAQGYGTRLWKVLVKGETRVGDTHDPVPLNSQSQPQSI